MVLILCILKNVINGFYSHKEGDLGNLETSFISLSLFSRESLTMCSVDRSLHVDNA